MKFLGQNDVKPAGNHALTAVAVMGKVSVCVCWRTDVLISVFWREFDLYLSFSTML